VLVRAATLLRMRGEDARCILAKRSQRILLGSSPRKRGPITTVSGYGSRLSARFASVGRDDRSFIRTKNRPAVAENDRRLRSIVFGLLFTTNSATRTCDTQIWRSSKTLAPRRETLALRSGERVARALSAFTRVFRRAMARAGRGAASRNANRPRMPRSCPSPASPLRGSAPSPRFAGRGMARCACPYLTTCIAPCRCRRRSRSARRIRRRTWRAAQRRLRGDIRRRLR